MLSLKYKYAMVNAVEIVKTVLYGFMASFSSIDILK